ncbi:MAG TPA: hypothetical protein VL171_12400 [Verrucomicrobiae bacterium]|nr:hypothetical protein [Verrucomicrobiae bacterium]
MKSLVSIRILYGVAAAYDGLLGLAFLVAGPQLFDCLGITPPNHWGYVHFSAGLLVIFGYMFLNIARRPIENRNLVIYGVLLKFCYVATVVWHSYQGSVPSIWKYFALADIVFAFLFLWSLKPLVSAASSTRQLGLP